MCKHFNKYYGECFEHKYYKKPSYRGLIKNSEILDTHIKNYELKHAPSKTLKKIFNFFGINNNSYNLKKMNNSYHSMEGNILRYKQNNLPDH